MVKKKIIQRIVAILIVLTVFFWSPLSHYPISLAIMKVYSAIHEKESVMEEKGIQLKIPGGRITETPDWFPFAMTFNASAGFRDFLEMQEICSGQPADRADYSGLQLTIVYNFPAFDMLQGCSRLYDSSSPYYNGFYGAYLVSGQTAEADGSRHPYGFTPEGKLDVFSVAQVPQFDFQELVLADMGIRWNRMVFDCAVNGLKENVSYAGSGGWTRADANLTVNGVFHQKKQFHRAYLQYGPPGYQEENEPGTADFAPVGMYGRVYGKYFEEWDTSVFFYILVRDPEAMERCDREILGKSTLS